MKNDPAELDIRAYLMRLVISLVMISFIVSLLDRSTVSR